MNTKKFIICPSCKEKSFIVEKKDFEGFDVIGEYNACGLCGYRFKEDEEINFVKEKSIFGDEGAENADRNHCRDCAHYITSPYAQKCMLKNTEVTALDGCEKFKEKKKRK